MPKFQSIIFDLDGTLTDPKEGITKSLNYALAKMGLKERTEQELVKYIGPPLKSIFASLTGSDDEEYIGRCIDAYRERFGRVGLFENCLYDGIPEMLESLQNAGARLFVATSKATVYAREILRHFNVQHFFEKIEGSNMNNTRQDKAEVIAYVLETAKLERKATVMVGDRKHDLIGAQKCGVPGIGVLFGYGSREELGRYRPVYMAQTVDELRRYLLKGL